MPSQFEPCGLSQMISLRYGTLPIVRETGGLRDTVLSYNEANGAGNGFSFFNYNAHDMLYVIRRAVFFYKEKPEVWKLLQHRAMTGDYSWAHSAEMYLSLYRDMLAGAAGKTKAEPAAEPAAEETPAAKKPRARKPKAEAAESAPAEKKPRAKKVKDEAAEAPAEKKTRARKPKAEAAEAPAEAPAKKPRAKKAKAEEPKE
jgi:starch synthase